MGSTIGKMAVFIRVILSRVLDTVTVFGKMKMSNTKVTTNWTKSKVVGSINGKINKSTKDSSKMTTDKAMANYTTSADQMKS